VKRYFTRKLFIYLLTFFVAVTIDWLIPRFMPGNPVQVLLARATLRAEAAKEMYTYYTRAFGLDLPLWKQYLNFWIAIFHGDFGTSILLFPQPVIKIIMRAVPYDIFLLLPAILLSFCCKDQVARQHNITNRLHPHGDSLYVACDITWLGIVNGLSYFSPGLCIQPRDETQFLMGIYR